MEDETSIGLIVGLGSLTLVFFGLLIAIITSVSKRRIIEKEKKLRLMEQEKQIDLFKAVAEAKEDQKLNVAKSLHNEIGSMILFISRSLSTHIAELEKQGAEVKSLKGEMDAFGALGTRVREIAHGMIPKLFTTFGVLKSIEAVVKKINNGSGATADFQNNTAFTGSLPFSPGEQLIVYEMTLEILNNLVKHANYTSLTVILKDMKESLTLEFVHDGSNITNEEIDQLMESGKGIGLKNLRSSALLLKARVDYSHELGVSYVKLIVPFKNEGTN